MDEASTDPTIVVERLKWPDVPLRSHRATPIGDDGWGTWLHVPAGEDTTETEGYDWANHHDAVLLLPRDGWWTAYWSTYGTIYVDIALVIRRRPSPLVVIDLDLDVVVDRDGRVRVDDEAEFEANQLELGYPSWLVEGARSGLDDVVDRLEREVEPFGTIGFSRLDLLGRR